jgi:hypothetical protein
LKFNANRGGTFKRTGDDEKDAWNKKTIHREDKKENSNTMPLFG